MRRAIPILAVILSLALGVSIEAQASKRGRAKEEKPKPPEDPAFIYGIHDPGGEHLMLEAGAPGWIVVCEAIGHDANRQGGRDYTKWTSKGLGVLVRLNNGWNPHGTLPYEKEYDNFAKRCANFVRGSKGARHWIIGNEANLKIEWPQEGGNEEPVTAARYVKCFQKVRKAIKAVEGHEDDLVIVQGCAVWHSDCGDWIQYFSDILKGLGKDLDGIALHTYTRNHDLELITSNERAGGGNFVHFRAYQSLMKAIPPWLKRQPVYITETNGGPWHAQDTGWIKAAYAEINLWNRMRGTQKVRALCLYRWPTLDDKSIKDKPGAIEDFKEALQFKYRWRK